MSTRDKRSGTNSWEFTELALSLFCPHALASLSSAHLSSMGRRNFFRLLLRNINVKSELPSFSTASIMLIILVCSCCVSNVLETFGRAKSL